MAETSSIDLVIVGEIHDSVNLSYVTRAKIYPEDPNSLFLTMRGDTATNAGGGISVYDVSDSRRPVFVSHLDVVDTVPGELVNPNQLEGQDRIGDILVVIALESGVVHLLDVSDPSQLFEVGSLKLHGVHEGLGYFPALHTKVYKEASSQKTYAIVTCSMSSKLIAVDISDPKNPKQVSELQTGISDLESLYIHGSFLYCGGFQSDVMLTVDLSDIHHMRLCTILKKSYYNNLVAELDPDNDNILYASSYMERKATEKSPWWERGLDTATDVDAPRGGLIVFDISQPETPVEISHVISEELAGSNRVKLHAGYAFLPIEAEPGGVGIVNLRDPYNVVFERVIKSTDAIKPYALAIKDNYIYVLGSESDTMVIKEIRTGTK
jgi:hypothetical protein